MSKYSIIREDNAVVVDGEHYQVDCSSLPANVHAIRWNGTRGHIEFVDEDPNDGRRDPNQTIDDFSPYQYLVDRWYDAKNEANAALAKIPKAVEVLDHSVLSVGVHVITE